MYDDMSDRAWYNVRWMKERDRGKGKGEKFRRNEEVNKRRGELSNDKLFLCG
jgi:hypothetical protein